MKITHGGVRIRDLTNNLPCSSQLSYRVIRKIMCIRMASVPSMNALEKLEVDGAGF